MAEKQITREGFELIAKKFKVLGDPARLQIIDFLRQKKELSVGEITEFLECSQPNASRHLSKLFDARIVGRRREGNAVLYFITDFSVFTLCEAMCGRLEEEAAGRLESLYVAPVATAPTV